MKIGDNTIVTTEEGEYITRGHITNIYTDGGFTIEDGTSVTVFPIKGYRDKDIYYRVFYSDKGFLIYPVPKTFTVKGIALKFRRLKAFIQYTSYFFFYKAFKKKYPCFNSFIFNGFYFKPLNKKDSL